MEYNFREIEKKWQERWAKEKTFKAEDNSSKPKYYVLDMFPYPSGAGLHVGHPLGYIASDIMARYKRHKGFNVLHPMGYDSFGLPAEQYAIQTGQHPAITTEQNIKRYREQLDKIGFSFDWDREVRTSNPNYYKWTQWIFIQIFNSWYNPKTNKAEHIDTLIKIFETEGFKGLEHETLTGSIEQELSSFTAEEWKNFDEKRKSDILMNFRLAYLGEAYVNWCPALGTVLANDEVKDGVSERGGYPVERKLMKQWSMRITAYAQRLLDGLETIDWTESLKESQRYWIGKSEGTSLKFKIQNSNYEVEVFTTRPDTIFGVSFVTLAPEHDLVEKITTQEQKAAVEDYVSKAKNRSERERQADVNKVSGVFTGAYVEHPFTKKPIPVWVGDYVLAGYGTGAVMAVPAHDERDFKFATHFGLAKTQVIEPTREHDFSKNSWDEKEGKLINSDFLNGLTVKEAIKKSIEEIEKQNLGKGKTNFRLRDAVFGRQRYWGEPIPIYYKNGIPYAVEEKDLPIQLPEVDKFLPTEDGEPPLARAKDWTYSPLLGRGAGGEVFPLETTTMPGWAGSSWYFLRYMDAKNDKEFVSKDLADYWQNVDLYIGGSEHATGHLLYFRFWTKFLYDRGFIKIDEPAKKLINQGMIQGRSNFVYLLKKDSDTINTLYLVSSTETYRMPDEIFISSSLIKKMEEEPLRENPRMTAEEEQVRPVTTMILKAVNRILNEYDTQAGLDYSGEFDAPSRKYKIGTFRTNIDINFVNNDVLDVERFEKHLTTFGNKQVRFIYDKSEGFICDWEIEKMSKSKLNVQTPDDICEKFGADTLRLYEMFLGPLEQSKPWNTNGITGVHNFLKKLWRLAENVLEAEKASPVGGGLEGASKAELKSLHKTIKKITEDIERFSFNTSVSNFMICVNELTEQKCNKRAILEPLLILISPYAPHIAEELWSALGHKESIAFAPFPEVNESYLVDDSFTYPISFNGKMRLNIELSTNLTVQEIEKEVLSREEVQKYLEGKTPKKVIIVPKKIVNFVV